MKSELLLQTYGSDSSGIVCGFVFSPTQPGRPISADDALECLEKHRFATEILNSNLHQHHRPKSFALKELSIFQREIRHDQNEKKMTRMLRQIRCRDRSCVR